MNSFALRWDSHVQSQEAVVNFLFILDAMGKSFQLTMEVSWVLSEESEKAGKSYFLFF